MLLLVVVLELLCCVPVRRAFGSIFDQVVPTHHCRTHENRISKKGRRVRTAFNKRSVYQMEQVDNALESPTIHSECFALVIATLIQENETKCELRCANKKLENEKGNSKVKGTSEQTSKKE